MPAGAGTISRLTSRVFIAAYRTQMPNLLATCPLPRFPYWQQFENPFPKVAPLTSAPITPPPQSSSARIPRALEWRLAERARRLVARREPLVEARRVEFVLAGLARQARQRVVGRVDYRVANGALLHALKLALHVLLPQEHRRRDGAVLVPQERRDGQQPLAQPALAHADALRALHLENKGRKRVWGYESPVL